MKRAPVEAPASKRGVINTKLCTACQQAPYPTHVLIEVSGEPVAVCSNPRHCRERAQVLGNWCTYP